MIVLTAAHPVDIDEDHADLDAIAEAAPNGHHFGDRLNADNDKYAPTTPRDAANTFSLSYVQNTFPEEPQQQFEPADVSSAKTRRSLDDDIVVNRHFFDSIYNGFKRNVRRAQESGAVASKPTIALGDLLSAVENSLVHSAQSLVAATNATDNNSNTTSDGLALPIDLPTAAPVTDAIDEDTVTTTESENRLHRDSRSVDQLPAVVTAAEHESVQRFDVNGFDLFGTPIVFNSPSGDSKATTTTTESAANAAANITIIQTINSTQLVPTETGHQVQQQYITLFSAADGIFPLLPSVSIENYNNNVQTITTASVSDEDDSSESSGSSSDEESAESKECKDSSEESNGKKCFDSKVTSATGTSSTSSSSSSSTTSTTTETAIVKAKKVEILKEKLAEIEAEPVILTQGI